MVSLFDAMNPALTANGALTNKTSMSACLDLFNVIGSSRGKDLRKMFDDAMAENPELTLRILQWVRDCRGGAGERELFRSLFIHAIEKGEHREQLMTVLRKVPELGYWKDIVVLFERNESIRPQISEMIKNALFDKDNIALFAKYMPRKGKLASYMVKALGTDARTWRKTMVELSNTVEQKMCAKQWSEINFSHVPSIAAGRYARAFTRNAPAEYLEYKAGLEAGTTKINASVLYPYDLIKNLRTGDQTIANAQWAALPNYMEGSVERVIPMIDVSGSMHCSTAISGISCMDIALSLGMYISERSEGMFRNKYFTFSSRPEMCELHTGSLLEKVSHLKRANWGMNTDICRAFGDMLRTAVAFEVPADQMPTMMIILSDMEFDSCARMNVTEFQNIQDMYKQHGYEVPKIVFWNLNPRPNNNPVTMKDRNTCSVSGFSPSIMKSILSGVEFDPYNIMLETVMVDRYSI